MKQDDCMTRSQTVYCAEQRLYLSYHLTLSHPTGARAVYDLTVEQMGAGGYENCRLCDIAAEQSMAVRIWHLFVKERVTPITAEDIMEQLLSDEAFLYAEEG